MLSGKFRVVLLAGLITAIAGAAFADRIALVIGNGVYDEQRNIRGVRDAVSDLVPVYEANGYTVIEGYDLTNTGFRDILTDFEQQLADAERVIVHYTGYTLNSGSTTWLAPVDLGRGSVVDTAYGAPSLDLILDMLATKPGRAALFIGTFSEGNRTAGGLSPGLGEVDVPQGVLVVSGKPTDIVRLLENSVLVEGADAASALAGADRNITVSGFISPDIGFGRLPPAAVEDDGLSDIERERQLWATVQAASTVENLQAYLDAYPDGAFAIIARNRLARLQEPSVDPAIAAEKALNLSRSARRDIQEDLTILGHDPRGIDGLFGPATRRAITSWQESQDLASSGYVSRLQIRLLESQAATRAKEVAAVAEQNRRDEERADLAYWRTTGANGTAAGLRDYLEVYPDGVYSPEATAALEDIEAEDRASAAAADAADWDEALADDTVDGYERYIRRQPGGAFVETAKARIKRLSGEPDDAQIAAYKRTEDKLGLSAQTRALIERRLKSLNFDPGRVDGRFDDNARRAIRRFQRSQGLEATGYVDGGTVRQLLIASL